MVITTLQSVHTPQYLNVLMIGFPWLGVKVNTFVKYTLLQCVILKYQRKILLDQYYTINIIYV